MDKNKNHVEKEMDLPFFDELNDLEVDKVFSEFMSQSPNEFCELEQNSPDEISSILSQGMDDSAVMHVPPSSPMLSRMELPSDFKKPQKKQSKSAIEEFDVLNPRRSKRIMLKRASGIISENMKRIQECLLEEQAASSEARPRARPAKLAASKATTKNRSYGIALKKLYKARSDQIHLQDARNEDSKSGIGWPRMMASESTMASVPFTFNPGNSAELLPNLQGHEHPAEVSHGFAGASLSSARGDGALPSCTADDSSENNGFAEVSGKATDLAPN